MIASKFEKYNISVPRYTSYPVITDWQGFTPIDWIYSLNNGYILETDIYIHIPFCEKLCYYCGCFRKITKDKTLADRYIQNLAKEWGIYTKLFPHIKVKSLHLGGGTPSFLTPNQLKNLLSLFSNFMSKKFEGNIELDPRTVTFDHIKILKSFGFNSASLGVQDFDAEVQSAINRIQSFEMVEDLVTNLRSCGFNQINFDLIWGLPNQTKATMSNTFAKVLKLRPDRISHYSYAHLPEKIKNQKLINESDILQGEEKAQLFSQGKEILLNNDYIAIGMDHYALRNSKFGNSFSNGKMSRNFMGYVGEKSDALIGLGVSSISQNSSGYVQNVKSLKEYEDALELGELPISKGHKLSFEEALRANIIQKIFCESQISTDEIQELSNTPEILLKLSEMETDGLLVKKEKEYSITEQGQKFIRVIASIFDQYRKNDYCFSSAV